MPVVPTASGQYPGDTILQEILPVNTQPHLVDGETTEWVVFCGEGCASARVGGAQGGWGWEKPPGLAHRLWPAPPHC